MIYSGGLDAARQEYVHRNTVNFLISPNIIKSSNGQFSIIGDEKRSCCVKRKFATTYSLKHHLKSAIHLSRLYGVSPKALHEADVAIRLIQEMNEQELLNKLPY